VLKKILFKRINIATSDMMAASGLLLLGYGLYLFAPWVSFSICGLLLLAGGALRGRDEAVKGKSEE